MKKIISMLTIIAATTLLPGCASHNSGIDRDYNPDKQLQQLMPKDYSGNGFSINCNQHIDRHNPAVDCEKLARKLTRLQLEYPNHQRIMMASAVVQYEMGRLSNSQFILDQLLSMPGANPEAAILRSRIAMAEGNINLARRVIDRQLQLVPDSAELYETRAASYFLEGRYQKALAELRSASLLGAQPWRVNYHNGLIYEALEEWGNACQQFFEVLGNAVEHRPSTARLMLLQEHDECHNYFIKPISSYHNNTINNRYSRRPATQQADKVTESPTPQQHRQQQGHHHY